VDSRDGLGHRLSYIISARILPTSLHSGIDGSLDRPESDRRSSRSSAGS
jgi:hypothetical protein